MPMTDDHTHMLVLTGDAGIKNATEVATNLRQAIENHPAVAIDTQALSAADVTTVQSLLAARVSARALGKQLRLLAPLGGPLQAVLDQAGFLTPGLEHAAFWSDHPDKPAGH